MSVELLAMMFYVAGGRISGMARLQYVVFLVQQELGLGGFRFTASIFGPWSRELEEAVRELVREGELSVEELEAKVFRASEAFMERGKKVLRDLFRRDPRLALAFCARVRIYAAMPLPYLLAYVQRKYPEYSLLNVIKDLGSTRHRYARIGRGRL